MAAVVSESMQRTVLEAAEQGKRLDGREWAELPTIHARTGCVAHASGSAEVRMGDAHVIVAVMVDLAAPSEARPDEGIAALDVSFAPHTTSEGEARATATAAAQLAERLEELVLVRDAGGPALDLHRLAIIPGRVCWRLNIDCVVLCAGAPLPDAASAAVRFALRAVRVPATAVTAAAGGEAAELGPGDVDLDDDPAAAAALDVSHLPVLVSACQLANRVALAPSLDELAAAATALVVAVDRKGRVCGVSKERGGLTDLPAVEAVVAAVQRRGRALLDSLDA